MGEIFTSSSTYQEDFRHNNILPPLFEFQATSLNPDQGLLSYKIR